MSYIRFIFLNNLIQTFKKQNDHEENYNNFDNVNFSCRLWSKNIIIKN